MAWACCWGSWEGCSTVERGSCGPSEQAQYCKTIWRKRHLSTAQKLTFKNNSQVFHIKNCKLQLKIKEDRKLMKIHFGKQWRQLEKCIIQCQETAQGSKPEPQPGTDWSVSTICCWKWVGEEGAYSAFLQTATIFHSTKDSGDIYFQNYSWTPSIKRLPLNSFLRLQHEEVSCEVPQPQGHNTQRERRRTSGGLRQPTRAETGPSTTWGTNPICSKLFQPTTVVRKRPGSSHMLKNYSAWILKRPGSCSSLGCPL